MTNMIASEVHQSLTRLDQLSLSDLAEYFDEQAELCRQEAVKTAKSELERQAAGINYIVSSPRIVMRHLKQGCTRDEALEKTAVIMGIPHGSIERTWMRFLSDKNIKELKRRNTLIIELVAMGFSNADIGRKVNLHPNTVSRIISKARADYAAARIIDNRVIQLALTSGKTKNKKKPR
ncbi:MAG: hypothetical protein JKY93_03100 [Gammaproteobacteria bacterium]|nr:hypothetical protein [Gammaproteobacteria bacterium]